MRTSGDHNQVSENVFNNLPQWEQDLWRDVRDPFIEVYSWYPDTLAPVNDVTGMLKTEPRYEELIVIDGRFAQGLLEVEQRPFWPFGRFYGERFDRIIEWPQFERVFGFYLDLMVQAIRRGDHVWAAKGAGIVSHILCDHHPCDHVDPAVWTGVLVPPPEGAKDVSDCWAIITQQVDIPEVHYKPILLGATQGQAMFRFYQRYLAMMKRGLGCIHQMLLEAYAGRRDKTQEILSHERLSGIEITSDFVHTAFCLALERFDSDDLAQARSLDLTEVFPTVNEMDFCYTFGPYHDAVIDFFPGGKMNPRKVSPALVVPSNGKAELCEVLPVLSVLADSGCQWPDRRARLAYSLPKGAYRRFRCLAGMAPAGSVSAKGVRGNVAAKVLGNGRVLWENPSVWPEDPAVEIDLPIESVTNLELLVTNLYTTSDQFWLGQYVWARPTLEQ